MTVLKKRTSASKNSIRKNFWKNKGYWTSLNAFSLGKSLSNSNSKIFFSNNVLLHKKNVFVKTFGKVRGFGQR